MLKCTLCGKGIVLIPSAVERAAKDVTGKSAKYYESLFTTHSECELAKRARDTSRLIERLNKDVKH